MIDTKNGAKYLDKDPPMEEHGGNITRKILDYLAYLKESLNFVFGTYGKRLTDSAGNINELHRTAEETISTISNMQGDMSRISQKADRIDLLVENVEGKNRIKSAAIMLAINGDTSVVKLSADKIDLEGYVTMTDLATGGRTVINGSNITTGIINADLITTGTLNADVISANSINVSKLNGSVTNGAWGVTFGSSPTFSVGYLSADRINAGYLSAARIEAGSITAEKININDLFSKNITASNFHITGGSVKITTNSGTNDLISLKYGNYQTSVSPYGIHVTGAGGAELVRIGVDSNGNGISVGGTSGVFWLDTDGLTNCKTMYGNIATTGLIREGTVNATSIPSTSTTTVATLSLPAGRYVVKGAVRSTESMTGFKICVGTIPGSVQGDSSIGGGTDNALTTVEILNLTATTTVYLTAYHSSGSSKTVSCSLRAIRIA